MAKCLVLGANGFIGSHLVDALIDRGETVRAFDRFPDSFKNFQLSENIEIFPGDFLNVADLEQSLDGIDYVFHFISTTTPATSDADPRIDVDTNIRMSISLFELCTKKNIKKVIFSSTGGAIYGDVKNGGIYNELTLPQPVSPYAIGKLTIEHYLRYFKVKNGLVSVTYRISNPYGERQSLTSKQGVIPIFLQQIARGEPITILGDGSMVRDYLYVKDVAEMISATYQNGKEPVYNLGSGRGYSINDIVGIIKRLVPGDIKVNHQPVPATYVHRVVLDTILFKNEFDMAPRTDLEEGINKTWQYVLNHHDIKGEL
ncbi:MAG TPA: NAD-dependent epimerase/dehydratase family protein [Candidatus Saccharimonadales bacterium]|jgi:UDP-glucose 4-epimerase|nr:NAD-dependent epimerase/dehydratase family protein [Candidatus Saccharimonadales bacterium]